MCVWSTHQPRLGEQQPQPWRRRALLGAAPTDAAPAGAGNPSGPANIAPRALQLSDLPDWVVAGEADMERESWRREHAKNVVRMAKVNADPSRRLDLVMWGDSLTSGLASNDDAWGEKFGDLDGLPLGVRWGGGGGSESCHCVWPWVAECGCCPCSLWPADARGRAAGPPACVTAPRWAVCLRRGAPAPCAARQGCHCGGGRLAHPD